MSQTFERIVDRKDAIITSLAKDLEEAEQQYQVALHSNMHKVDDVLGRWSVVIVKCYSTNFKSDFQTKRIQNLEAQYKEQLDILKKEFDTERYIMLLR